MNVYKNRDAAGELRQISGRPKRSYFRKSPVKNRRWWIPQKKLDAWEAGLEILHQFPLTTLFLLFMVLILTHVGMTNEAWINRFIFSNCFVSQRLCRASKIRRQQSGNGLQYWMPSRYRVVLQRMDTGSKLQHQVLQLFLQRFGPRCGCVFLPHLG